MIQIRHAHAAGDAAACAAIYAPYVLNTPISFEEQPPTAAEMALRIEQISERYPWLVAEEGGSASAFAYGSLHRERPAYRWAADVTVYVAEEFQRRGIGRALYAELLRLLGLQGIQVACAGVTLPNAASVALHEALGFQPVGVYHRIGSKFGKWHDVAWWELELVPRAAGLPPEVGPPARPGGEPSS